MPDDSLLCLTRYSFEDKIDNFQVNTNPLLKHTVTLSVVGKSSGSSVFLKYLKIKSCKRNLFEHPLIIHASAIKAKLARIKYCHNYL